MHKNLHQKNLIKPTLGTRFNASRCQHQSLCHGNMNTCQYKHVPHLTQSVLTHFRVREKDMFHLAFLPVMLPYASYLDY